MRAKVVAAGVAALFGTFVHLSSASAAVCLTSCSGTKPICSTLGLGGCVACTSDSECSLNGLPGTCVTQGELAGSCYQCMSDNASGGTSPCLDVNFPACHDEPGPLQYHCTVCSSTRMAACNGHPLTPICVDDAGVCGCDTAANVCSATTNGQCVLDAGAAGECVSSNGCDAGSCKTAPNLVCDTSRNTCVECESNAQCNADGGLICAAGVCSVDAGTRTTTGDDDGGSGSGDAGEQGDGSASGDDGGGTTGDDGGGLDASSDAGIVSTGDATITGSTGSVTYPYGHVEGGGCMTASGAPGESGAGSFGASLVTGLAALAGILSIRTRRRRNGQDQNR